MTLYDLLGALPNDDAEGLRTAFRRAVKSAHPDIRPGDPDAAWKFRRIVRAHEILGDTEQRAAYDHLLDLAHQEEEATSGHATAARIRRLASGAMAIAGVSFMTIGGYLLFMHMSAASLALAGRINPTTHTSASLSPALPPLMPGKGTSVVKDERAGIAGEAVEPGATNPQANPPSMAAANIGPTPDLAAGNARPPRPHGAVASLNQASLLDPRFSSATIGRGVMFYRLRKFDRAFADIEPTRQQATPGRSKPASMTPGAPRLGPAAIARPPMPVP